MTFNWPPISNQAPTPKWVGNNFVIGDENVSVLCYHEVSSGWNNELTQLHEDTSGENHFIDKASRQNAINALTPVLAKPTPVILEVGCSSGFFLDQLRIQAKHAQLLGSDFISGPLYKLANRLKGVPIAQFDITKCPFEDASVDGVVALNVLEHIEDDLTALKQIYRILKPGGLAIIEVPAGPHLYDFYDKHLLHYRRYKLNDLKELAIKANFKIEKASHLGFFIYPFFSIVKKINLRKEKLMTEIELQNRVAKQIKQAKTSLIMNIIMKIELALAKYLSYPIGIRCLVTLKK